MHYPAWFGDGSLLVYMCGCGSFFGVYVHVAKLTLTSTLSSSEFLYQLHALLAIKQLVMAGAGVNFCLHE